MTAPVADAATPAAPPIDMTAAREAVATAPTDAGTLTDGHPGILTIAGIPMRPFSYFEFRCMRKIQEATGINPEDAVIILAYSMAQTTTEELDALHSLALDVDVLISKAERWSMNFGMEDLAPISAYVAGQLDEYVETAGEGGPDGESVGGLEASAEGNLKPSPQESPSSDAQFSDSPA